MKNEKLYEVLGDINEKYVKEAREYRNTKKSIWIKWGAMAACLCLMIGLVIPILNNETAAPQQDELPPVSEELPPMIDEGPAGMYTPDQTEIVEFNGAEYVVCGKGEEAVLQEYGIPAELTEDLAGEHVCYLGISDNRYIPVEKADSSEENDIELFEYAPAPNENIYIMCRSGEYYAAIRSDIYNKDEEPIPDSNEEDFITENEQVEVDAEMPDWGISMSVKNVTPTGLTLVCEQSGGRSTGKLQTDSFYKLVVLSNGTRQDVPCLVEVAWTEEAYMISMDDTAEWEIAWELLYGELSAGTYRIIKNVTDFRKTGDYDRVQYWAEFELD